MRWWIVCAVAALVTLFGVSLVGAQEDVSATVTTDATGIAIGDVIPLTLTVTHPAGWRVIAPELIGQWGDFEIVEQYPPDIRANGSTETTTQRIDVQVFGVGDFQTPPLNVEVVSADGQIAAYPVASATITVESVLTGGDTLLRDIKPQASMEIPPLSPLVIGGAALSILALIGLIALVMRIFAREPAFVDTRTTAQRAQDDLAEILEMGLITSGEYKAHFDLVSDTLRKYIEDVFGFPATDLTTTEIRREFLKVAIPPDQSQFAVDILESCDLVKFSKVAPTDEDARQIVDAALQFIFLTEPSATKTGTVEMVA